MQGTCLGVLPSVWTNRVAGHEKARYVNIYTEYKNGCATLVSRLKIKNSMHAFMENSSLGTSPLHVRICNLFDSSIKFKLTETMSGLS